MAKRSDFAGMDLLTAFGEKESSRAEIQVSDIVPNPSQPRVFGKEEVSDLVESMKRLGLIEPIVVKKQGKNIKLWPEKEGIKRPRLSSGIRLPRSKLPHRKIDVLKWRLPKTKNVKA